MARYPSYEPESGTSPRAAGKRPKRLKQSRGIEGYKREGRSMNEDNKWTCSVCKSGDYTYFNPLRDRIICFNPECDRDGAITMEEK